jgi:hypothetical protein
VLCYGSRRGRRPRQNEWLYRGVNEKGCAVRINDWKGLRPGAEAKTKGESSKLFARYIADQQEGVES